MYEPNNMATRLSPTPAYGADRPSTQNTLSERPSDESQRGRPHSIDLSLGAGARISGAPSSPVRISTSERVILSPSTARIETASPLSSHRRTPTGEWSLSMPARDTESPWKSPSSPSRAAAPAQHQVRLGPGNNFSRPKSPLAFGTLAGYSHPDSPQIYATDESGSHSYLSELDGSVEPEQPPEALTYFHTRGLSDGSAQRDSLNQSSPDSRPRSTMSNGNLLARPMSAMLLEPPGRSPSPGVSPDRNRNSVYGRSSPSARPMSYIDLLNAPYPQPAPSASKVQNDALRPAIGLNASLLSSQKTFEMYLANVKKTPDLHTQYSFATFLVRMSQEAREDQAARPPSAAGTVDDSPMSKPDKLVSEARKILESLAGKSYPFAQYYLADGFTSGLFTKSGTPDNDHALPLFVAASKHGHAEAGYRAGLCYEFGWGARRDGPKAWQYFRQSASKGHPGAMGRLSRACLTGDLGQPISEREGVRWLRRAAEKADEQFSSAPYDLGLLHEYGYGSDVFKDEVFAAQLFTKSAGLGHADAAFKMGRAYEHGLLQCPQDSGLSIHFYHTAANAGHSEAMLNLAAWYLLGCEVLEKDEEEAYEWAKRSAALENPKGIFTVGWFRETGTGCRRDPLEANVCYVKAADLGYERAQLRIKAINAAASNGGGSNVGNEKASKKDEKRDKNQGRKGEEGEKRKKKLGIF